MILTGLTPELKGALPSLVLGETSTLGAPSDPALMDPRGPSLLSVVLVSVDKAPCVTGVTPGKLVVDCLVVAGVVVELVFVQDMGVPSRALTCSNWFFRLVRVVRRSSRRELSAFS